MARKKADGRRHQPFEGKNSSGAFTKITNEMMQSPAWEDLNIRQQGLYLRLKSKYREKRVNGVTVESNVDNISLPKAEWHIIYGDYRTFKKDMDALHEKGFIRTVARAKYMGEPNIYGFTDKWTEYKPSKKNDTS